MELDLRSYIKAVKKRVWMIVIAVLSTCGITAVLSYTWMQPVYDAETKLIVNKTNDLNEMNYMSMDSIQTNLMLINTYKEIIKTPIIVEKVVQKLPELKLSNSQLLDKISVNSLNNTLIIQLNVRDASQATAVKIVNTVAEVFKNEVPEIMKVDNVVILNEAKADPLPTPANLQPKWIVAIAFMMSLITSIGVAVLREMLDDTIRSEDQAELLLRHRVIVTIPKATRREHNNRKTKNKNKQSSEVVYASIQ